MLGKTSYVSFAVAFGLVAASSVAADKSSAKTAKIPGLYDGFEKDRALLRKTTRVKVTGGKKPFVEVSSAEACMASWRIFHRVSFLYRTRDEVLRMLGDPATVSDYGRPTGKKPTSPLVYVFSSGFGGWEYTISFDSTGRVNQVRADSQE